MSDAGGGTKLCRRCKKTKPLAAFYRNRSNPDGRNAECEVCVKERRATYYLRRSASGTAQDHAYREVLAASLTVATAESLMMVLQTLKGAIAGLRTLESAVAVLESFVTTGQTPALPQAKRGRARGPLPQIVRPAPDLTKPPPIRTIQEIMSEDRVKARQADRIQQLEIVARAEWKPPR